jgi:hypothetical protein
MWLHPQGAEPAGVRPIAARFRLSSNGTGVRDLSSRYKHVTDFYSSLFGNVAYRKGEAAEDVGFE